MDDDNVFSDMFQLSAEQIRSIDRFRWDLDISITFSKFLITATSETTQQLQLSRNRQTIVKFLFQRIWIRVAYFNIQHNINAINYY